MSKSNDVNVPPRGADGGKPTPEQVRAWLAECRRRFTPEERAEYDRAGRRLRRVVRSIGMEHHLKEELA